MNPIIGLEHGKVKLEEYNPLWDNLFLEEEQLLSNLLGGSIITIAHIGSTAISGIRSKPIIDILLVIPDASDLKQVTAQLSTIGFIIGIHQIHEGIFFMKGSETIQTHHLHLMLESQNWQGYIFFRDFLRHNSDEAQKYENLKLELEKMFSNERQFYTASKKGFIEAVIQKSII